MIYAFMGAYCYYHQQTEWARELGQAIISEKLDSLLDGNGTVNLEGLDDSIKKAYIGLVISMYIALEGPMAFVDILNYALVGQGLIGLNMAAYATTIAYTSLQNITDDIKKFIIEHQTYIPKDIIDILLTVFGYVSKGGAGAILGSIGFCMWFGDKILSFRDYYLPKEYWKYISYHRSWYDGYELRCYVGEDHCIHYIEIPKNPDGSLRWDEAVYI